MNCILCSFLSTDFEANSFRCPHCKIVFKNPISFLNEKEDETRYRFHQNTIDNVGYVNFLNKVVSPLKPLLPKKFVGLDFGCGPGPTLFLLLEKLGGKVFNYDLIFYPDKNLLVAESYELVVTTEVVEHFKTPHDDFKLLMSLVKKNGLIAFMTQLYCPSINYKTWWYKEDPTHVVFYQKETFEYLARKYQMEIIYSDEKSVIIMKRK